jgi:predicted porin
MKKSLFAVAAITAFAGAAQAQSSVTVYGIVDAGFSGTTSRVPQINTAGSLTNSAYKTNATSFGSGSESTSRMGFRGTEDLGGGTSAFFTLEMQLAVNSDNNFTNMTNRQSFVGVKKNGLGQAAIGTQYTPIHLAVAASDPGQANNVHGNVIYAVNGTTANAGQSIAYSVRANNAMTFATDKFAGFGLNGIYSNNNTDRTQLAAAGTSTNVTNGGNVNNTAWGIGADYTWQKLYATAAYQSLKNETDTVVNTVATINAISSTVGTNQPTVNGTSNQTYAAATYDFGILKAYAQWIDNKTTSNFNGNLYIKRQAQQLGVRSMITPKIETWGSVGNGRYAAYGASSPTANFTGYQVGANYLLSKRTNFYAIFGSSQTSTINTATTSSTAANGAVAVNGAAGNSGYAVGLRHTF